MKITIPKIGDLSTYQIRTYEIDHAKKATLPALIKLMHEAAMTNVIRLKLSVWDLEDEQIAWVLMRKKMMVYRLPDLGEQVHVLTHPAGFEKFFTYRDYRVFDDEGHLLASSASTWLLMDTIKRRMARIPDRILGFNDQMPPLAQCLARPKFKLPKFEAKDNSIEFTVGWYDLDFNGHLNNVFYIQWMLEALPHEVLNKQSLATFEIEYRIEGRLGNAIQSIIQQVDDRTFLHKLVRKMDGKEMALGRTVWHP